MQVRTLVIGRGFVRQGQPPGRAAGEDGLASHFHCLREHNKLLIIKNFNLAGVTPSSVKCVPRGSRARAEATKGRCVLISGSYNYPFKLYQLFNTNLQLYTETLSNIIFP